MRRWIIIPVMGLCVATVMGAAIVDRYQDQERAGVAAEERDALDEACVLESEARRQRGPASCPPARHKSDSHVAHWPGDLLEAPVKMLAFAWRAMIDFGASTLRVIVSAGRAIVA